MSGPKVIRVVTREELEAICSRLISQVGAVGTDLLRTLKRHGQLTDVVEQDIGGRIKALSDQLRAGQLAAVEKHAPLLVAFLRNEKQRYQQLAIARAEATRKQRQQLVDAASSVATALQQQNKPIPAELARVVDRARSARVEDLPSMRAEVDKAFRALVVSAGRGPVASKDLATRLSGGLESLSLSEWLSMQKTVSDTPDRLNRIISELEVIEDEAVVGQFATRVEAIDRERQVERRRLLEDSLLLDVSAALSHYRKAEETRASLLEVDAELAAVGGPAALDLRARTRSVLSDASLTGAVGLLEQARTLIEASVAETAAISRRKAVLTGLAGLGYEVRAGMETAWAQEGRIVVAKPGVTDYGVELGGPADASRLQVKVVGAERPLSPRSPQRDTEQEQLWCSEVDDLIASLDRNGTELIIERALAVGAQSMKSTTLVGRLAHEIGADELSRPKSRATE
jgi:hypothetical protein